ncbi:hypothetical protein H0H93_009267 [Arthromyces matolae]|nr:hypothetical protein H0H93_009267 [Arthromyces matolae]
MKSLEALRSVARRQRIKIWRSKRVNDLGTMVDSLKKFDFPLWLIHECEDRIRYELRWVNLFLRQEAGNTYYLTTIKQHKEDLLLLKEKLARERPPSPASFYEDSEEEDSSECESQQLEAQLHGVDAYAQPSRHPSESPSPSPKEDMSNASLSLDVNKPHPPSHKSTCRDPENKIDSGHPDPSRSPSTKEDPNTSHHVIASDINEPHDKARRERIDKWHANGIKPLEKKVATLPTLGFPSWLVYDECEYEIYQTLALIAKFQEVETDEGYIAKIQKHKDAMKPYWDIFRKKRSDDFYYHYLSKLRPEIQEGGRWRRLINNFAYEVKNLHLHAHLDLLYNHIGHGLIICEDMLRSGPLEDQTGGREELEGFESFLTAQRDQVTEAKEKFDADQPPIGPLSTERS